MSRYFSLVLPAAEQIPDLVLQITYLVVLARSTLTDDVRIDVAESLRLYRRDLASLSPNHRELTDREPAPF